MEVDRGGRRELEIVESTFHRRRNQYGRMKADDAKRLKELTLLRHIGTERVWKREA